MMATENNLHPVLSGYIAWIKAHETLLIIVLASVLTFHFWETGLQAWVNHDKRLADIAQQKVSADHVSNQVLETELAGLKLQLDKITQQTQQNIRQRNEQTTDQKEKNNQATTSEVAARIVQLLRVQPQEVTTSSIDGTVQFTPSAAHADVNALEDGQTAQQNILDLTAQNTACATVVSQNEKVIAGLHTELTDEKTSHIKDVNEEKANSKKQYRRGFEHGYIAGVLTAVVIKVAKYL